MCGLLLNTIKLPPAIRAMKTAIKLTLQDNVLNFHNDISSDMKGI